MYNDLLVLALIRMNGVPNLVPPSAWCVVQPVGRLLHASAGVWGYPISGGSGRPRLVLVLRVFRISRRMVSRQTVLLHPGMVRVAIQAAWNIFHNGLKTAPLQGEAYDQNRDIICRKFPSLSRFRVRTQRPLPSASFQ